MLNNPFVLELSDNFARRVIRSTKDSRGRVALAFELAYGRSPSNRELSASLEYLNKAKSELERDPQSDANRAQRSDRYEEIVFQTWSQMCQSLLGSAEFRLIR
jgi:hypothetical protein